MRRLLLLLFAGLSVGVEALEFDQVEFQHNRRIEGISWGHLDSTSLVDHFVVEETGTFMTWDKSDGWVKRVRHDGVVEMLYQMTGSFDRISSYTLAQSGRYLTVEQYIGTYIIANLLSGLYVELRFPDLGLSASPLDFSAQMHSNLLVYEPDAEREFHTFQIVESDDGLETMYRDPHATRAFIEETYEGTDGFHYDNDGYLFFGERLVTANGETFASYFSSGNSFFEFGREISRSDARFLGVDSVGNYYWIVGRLVVVYGPFGDVEAAIGFDPVPAGGGLQIDPHGNIYVLSYGGQTPGQLDLLWIENTWSTQTSGDGWSGPPAASEPQPSLSARLAVPVEFLGSPVALRESAGVAAQSVGYAHGLAEVDVLEQTEPFRIGPLSEPWYRVVAVDGTQGWIYGAFLEFSE